MPLKRVSRKIEIRKTTSMVVFIQCNKVISEEVIEVELSTWRGLFVYNQSSHSLEAKGQLISKCPFGVKTSSKKTTKFLPRFLP